MPVTVALNYGRPLWNREQKSLNDTNIVIFVERKDSAVKKDGHVVKGSSCRDKYREGTGSSANNFTTKSLSPVENNDSM